MKGLKLLKNLVVAAFVSICMVGQVFAEETKVAEFNLVDDTTGYKAIFKNYIEMREM